MPLRQSLLHAKTAKALGAVAMLLGGTVTAIASAAVPAGAAPGAPGTPTHVKAIGANTAIDVSWHVPSSEGGAPISGYTVAVTGTGGPFTCATNADARMCSVAGLQNGSRYSTTVTAQNDLGSSKASKAVMATPTNAVKCSATYPYAELHNCDLSHHKYKDGTDLAYSNLFATNLTHAKLDDVDLSGADLQSTNFTDATLTGADLDNDTLFRTTLDGTVLTDADLSGTDLSGATLMSIISGGITGTPSAVPAPWALVDGYLIGPSANLSGAQLSDANLSDTNLSGANLTNADLSSATMVNANLTGAVLTNADLSGADLVDASANPTGANLSDANLSDANLSGAYLSGSDLSGADLSGAILSATKLADTNVVNVSSGGITGTPGALPTNCELMDGYLIGPGVNLASAELPDVNLNLLDLTGIDLSGADLSEAGLTNSDLSNANLSGADLDNADVDNDTLTDADLSGVILGDSGITNSSMTGVNFTDVNVSVADIGYDDFTNATLLGDIGIKTAYTYDDTWSNTICPDGTNSDVDGYNCDEDG